jgi:pimeloyl-ACP methyl ester carboxylesterase
MLGYINRYRRGFLGTAAATIVAGQLGQHNYRWRLGLADGEATYDQLEEQLAQAPVISVPTITLEGDANGAPHPDSSSYAKKFSGRYSHQVITGGVGHNLPQEAPQAFADAITEVVRY